MANTFLPILFNNLPSLFQKHYIYAFLWIISLIIFIPRVFTNKLFIIILFYGIFLFISYNYLWPNMDDWNKNFLYKEYLQISVGATIFIYFNQTKNYEILARVTKWTVFFIIITALMSVITASIDPMYARNIIGAASVTIDAEKEEILSYKRFGGGTYGSAITFMSLIPLLIYLYKNNIDSFYKRKEIIIFIFILFAALLSIQLFTNIIIASIIIFISILGSSNFIKSIFIICMISLILYMIPKKTYIDTLILFSELFETKTEISYKFRDLAQFIDGGADLEDRTSGTASRAVRFYDLVDTFKKSPVFGCFYKNESQKNYDILGVHLYWANKLTTTGIIGFTFFSLIIIIYLKLIIINIPKTFRFYLLISMLSILGYGIFKTLSSREAWYTFFIVLPGIYHLSKLNRL